MAELIELSIGVLTCDDPKNHIIDGGPDPRTGNGTFGGHTRAVNILSILNAIRKGAPAVRLLAVITVATCLCCHLTKSETIPERKDS